MSKSTGSYPSLIVDTTAQRAVSHAGAVLLAATASRIGLDRELSIALAPWMRPLAVHDPGKVLLDLAIAVAIGGDCLADIAQVRSEPGVFGHVASDPNVDMVTTRSGRGSTTAPAAPVNPSRWCSEKATQARTRQSITSRSPRPHDGNCRPPVSVGDPGGRC